MFTEYLGDLIEDSLNDILNEPDDLGQTHDQMRRCVFLISLFSHFYDDPKIYGICKYDKLFLCRLMSRLEGQTNQMVSQGNVEPANYYRLIYLLDKMMSNWLDNLSDQNSKEYDRELLFEVRNHLIMLSETCKNHFKLITLALCTIVANISQIQGIQVALGED